MVLLAGWFATALPAEPDPAFAVDAPAGRYVVTGWSLPPAAQLAAADRTCRVELAWSPSGPRVADRGCPAAVWTEVATTVRGWTVEGDGEGVLGELWFVYPADAPRPPRLLVRQAQDRAWTLPTDVDVVPYLIRAWSFLRYPREAHRSGAPDVSCAVQVAADAAGYTTNVRVEGCPAPFAEAARDAVAEWRFDPPLVDGEPIPSALGMTATFVAADPPAAAAPGADREQLWADRQFDSLTREERIWFIRAALLGPELRDLGPGQVRVALPAPPDLGGREPPKFFHTSAVRTPAPARELPDHPPVFVVGPLDHTAVEVYEFPLPAPAPGPELRQCPLLVQVDERREVFAWAEPGCDDELRPLALAAVDQWVLRHLGEDGRVRFHTRVDAGPDGVSVTFPTEELRTPLADLPAGVHRASAARPERRVPPKIRPGTELPSLPCELEAVVSPAGGTREVTVVRCDPSVERAAIRAVRRWRWVPAELDGVAIESRAPVLIRFAP